MHYWIILSILVLFSLFYVYIYLLKLKIELLEYKIIWLFNKRNNWIPSLFETTKSSFVKHDEIFEKILQLKKYHFSETNWNKSLSDIIGTQELIHKEINFIFKVSNKHPKLLKSGNFLYMRDIFLNKSSELWKHIEMYKAIITTYNSLLTMKNATFFGIFIPLHKKHL